MQTYEGNDIYCELIIPGNVPIDIVMETDTVVAYHHTAPHWPVHIVVTPKRHTGSLLSLSSEPLLAKQLLTVISKVSEEVVRDKGACRVLTNLGEYQDSKHLHFHVTSGEPLR